MKYLTEFRNGEIAQRMAREIHQITTRPWKIMEVCGGQTHSIIKNGIDQMLPPGIEMIHGPGCPVCVTPLALIDKALAIAAQPGVIFCSFGDMLRVPGTEKDLFQVKGAGGDVRVVYSPLDAVELAEKNPDKQVVFFGVGFETTAPANAMSVHAAKRRGLKNFSLLVSHVLVPPAIEAILQSPGNQVQGFLLAGHVCTVMGYWEYPPIADRYHIPLVVTGFEPLDLLDGIRRVVTQLERGEARVENAYERIVSYGGNLEAQQLLGRVFEVTDRAWRGIGVIPGSGWRLNAAYRDFDAEQRFQISGIHTEESALCRAGDVLRGAIKPAGCPAFGKQCTPRHPLGATMVSSEGACAAYFNYGRFMSPEELAGAGKRMTGAIMPESTIGSFASVLSQVPKSEGPGAPDFVAVPDFSKWSCPLPLADYPAIMMGHGGGGKLGNELVEHLFLPAFHNAALENLGDAAVLDLGLGRLAMSTDSFVVQPLFFPGGSIGELAVNGTVNDLAVSGAVPKFLSASFILEEGFPLAQLAAIVESMATAAANAGVQIVTGDTKVVERGHGDGCYINTAGVGLLRRGIEVGPNRAEVGDAVLVSGTIGDHGMAIMSVREGLQFESQIRSDCASLNGMITQVLNAAGNAVHTMRDPTRGGLASTLNEIAAASNVGIDIDESALPVRAEVQSACELLGLDPVYVANEGKAVFFVAPEFADVVLSILQAHPLGRYAARIGEVTSEHKQMLVARTAMGANRVIPMQIGEQLPRIC